MPEIVSLANDETATLEPGVVSFLLKKSTSVQPGSQVFSCCTS